MGRTSIEWTEYSWNPLRGVKGKWHCTKVSPGCANCYAERLNMRFSGIPYAVGADTIRLDEKVLTEPLRWRTPRMLFVCSMTDLFHEQVTDEMLCKVWSVMADCNIELRHVFQVLTKRPERVLAWMQSPAFRKWQQINEDLAGDGGGNPWPLPNVWLGVSCENQEMADKRIPILLQIPAAVRWVSAEPLLGPIDLQKSHGLYYDEHGCDLRKIDWLVVGGESGPGARPFDPEWGRNLLRQCRAADVPFFGKQWDKKRELPDDLMVREMPTALTGTEGRG